MLFAGAAVKGLAEVGTLWIRRLTSYNDYNEWLEKSAPHEPIRRYRHNNTGEDNANTNGQLDFGPWEQIFYGEFDGRRQKCVLVKIIGK